MGRPRIKKNDTVIVVSGVSRGKTGKVLYVVPSRGRAVVEGLQMVKKALRKSQDNPQGGIVEREAPIAVSNLMPYCPDCRKGVRLRRAKEGEVWVRKCGRCGRSFDG